MDVTSYLLGKQAGGGGGQPTLQEKEITITENGTTSVVADTGYDGLSEVEITTNVSGGGAEDYFNSTIYSGTSSKAGILSMIINIPSTVTVSGTSLEFAFANCGNLQEIPYMDTSNITSFKSCFNGCYALKNFPVLDFSRAIKLSSVWDNCNSLTDTSMDNILQTLISATSYTGTKTLANIGYWIESIYPASRWEALPHYQDFINAGWTIGY